MSKAINLSNKTFGRLLVIKRVGSDKYGCALWLCLCDCGNIVIIRGASLTAKNKPTQSCGCLHSENAKKAKTKHGHCTRVTRSTEWIAWKNMKTRCHNINAQYYKDYGGRGITVCDRWNSFENFLADMGPKPSPDYSIDRINNDGDYCPENCKWSTAKEQRTNQRPRKDQKWFRAHNNILNAVRYSNNQNQFAREYSLTQACIKDCLKKRQKQTKGWTFTHLERIK